MDQLSNHKDADLIAGFAQKLAKDTKLKSLNLKTDLFSKLLMLEKAGVDTSRYYNRILDAKLNKEDIEDIEQKFEVNCPSKINKKDTDFHEYVLKITKKKPKPTSEEIKNPEMDEYLDDLRNAFTQFLSDVVKKDYKKQYPGKQIKSSDIINYYFKNREKFEDQLDKYDLMLGQTEGILSDESYLDEVDHDLLDEVGKMIRRAPHT